MPVHCPSQQAAGLLRRTSLVVIFAYLSYTATFFRSPEDP